MQFMCFECVWEIIEFACKISSTPKSPKYSRSRDKIGNMPQLDLMNIPIIIAVQTLQSTKDMHAMHPVDIKKRDASSDVTPMQQ